MTPGSRRPPAHWPDPHGSAGGPHSSLIPARSLGSAPRPGRSASARVLCRLQRGWRRRCSCRRPAASHASCGDHSRGWRAFSPSPMERPAPPPMDLSGRSGLEAGPGAVAVHPPCRACRRSCTLAPHGPRRRTAHGASAYKPARSGCWRGTCSRPGLRGDQDGRRPNPSTSSGGWRRACGATGRVGTVCVNREAPQSG